MLNKIDLKKSLDKKQFKLEMKHLKLKVNELEKKLYSAGIPVVIVFEGWSASGKGTMISKVTYNLDPRYFNVHTMSKSSEERTMRPMLWAYWKKLPSNGRITIFDKSWHRSAIPEASGKWNIDTDKKKDLYYDINSFDSALCDAGVLVIKLFLHISKDEQKRRFELLQRDSATEWRINDHDWKQNKDYEKNLALFEEMIHKTSVGENSWNIIESNDMNYATVKILKTVTAKIEDKLATHKNKINVPVTKNCFHPDKLSALNSVNLNKKMDRDEYKKKLEFYQNKIAYLGHKLYSKRKSVVIVYEGWDAAGKGGNIKRLTQELDPRSYEVVPIAAPTAEELNHHYLWRFWNKMPKDGHFTIFDRSWYGRVMVERIEGFCTDQEWNQAYKEINDMELHIANHGTVIFKFWLHVDKDEQLMRFQARQNNPLKEYKITDEDWRNREKWDQYQEAVNEMLVRTDTKYAPWTIIESNDKKFARIKVLSIVCEQLEKSLK